MDDRGTAENFGYSPQYIRFQRQRGDAFCRISVGVLRLKTFETLPHSMGSSIRLDWRMS
jgi:hypothetical protein